MSKKKLFSELSKEERIVVVRKAMEAGHSNKSAAEELGTTPGTIAGIRHKNNIPSKNKASGSTKAVASPSERVAPPKRKPLTTITIDEPKPRRPKLASEYNQCAHEVEGRRCAYEREPGSDYCFLHDK